MNPDVRKLPQKWRDEAQAMVRHKGDEAIVIAGTYKQCAHELEAALAAQDAARPAEAGDWVLVPRAMPRAMLEAMLCRLPGHYDAADARDIYRNMLTAAPAAPAGEWPKPLTLPERLAREAECTDEAARQFYAEGWNACLEAMKAAAAPAPDTAGEGCKRCEDGQRWNNAAEAVTACIACMNISEATDGWADAKLTDAGKALPPGAYDLYTAPRVTGGREVVVEAVARVVSGKDGPLLDWLTEGGICALEIDDFLCVTNAAIPDDGLLVFQAATGGASDA